MKLLKVLILIIFCLFIASPATGQFGNLPDGYLFNGELKDIKGELALEFLSDWAPEIDTTKFELIKHDNSKFLHIFGVADIGSYIINDPKLNTSGKIAFWWMPVNTLPEMDSITNNMHFLQLKFWVSNKSLASAYKSNGLKFEIAEINTEYDELNSVFEIKSKDTYLRITMKTPESEPSSVNYNLPAYTTIWSPNSDLSTYQRITFHDHKIQYFKTMELELISEIETRFFEEMKKSYEKVQLNGSLQSNWQAKFAVYAY